MSGIRTSPCFPRRSPSVNSANSIHLPGPLVFILPDCPNMQFPHLLLGCVAVPSGNFLSGTDLSPPPQDKDPFFFF